MPLSLDQPPGPWGASSSLRRSLWLTRSSSRLCSRLRSSTGQAQVGTHWGTIMTVMEKWKNIYQSRSNVWEAHRLTAFDNGRQMQAIKTILTTLVLLWLMTLMIKVYSINYVCISFRLPCIYVKMSFSMHVFYTMHYIDLNLNDIESVLAYLK